jgi:hypothetical protein
LATICTHKKNYPHKSTEVSALKVGSFYKWFINVHRTLYSYRIGASTIISHMQFTGCETHPPVLQSNIPHIPPIASTSCGENNMKIKHIANPNNKMLIFFYS